MSDTFASSRRVPASVAPASVMGAPASGTPASGGAGAQADTFVARELVQSVGLAHVGSGSVGGTPDEPKARRLG